MTINIYHPNGKKYFYFLEKEFKVRYINYVFLRKIIGYHKGDNSKVGYSIFNKIPKKCDVAIFCIAPFDPNIFMVLFQKIIFGSKIIYHTSYIDHKKGRFYKFLKYPFKLIVNSLADRIICTPEILKKDLEKIYKIEVQGINHPIQKIPIKPINNKIYDAIFVGEKSEKKGYSRFIYLAKKYPDKKFISIGNKLMNYDTPPNLIDINYSKKSEIYNQMSMSKILILPSKKVKGWEELFGIVQLEALSLNLNVYSSDHIGPKYLKKRFKDSITLIKDSDEAWGEITITNKKINVCQEELEKFKEEAILNNWKLLIKKLK